MPVPTLTLKNGHAIPVLGQGTWELGEPAGDRAAEIATLRAGVELGLSLIDTAEMYGQSAWWAKPFAACANTFTWWTKCCPATLRTPAPSKPVNAA